MSTRYQLISLLSDGQFHSGATLGQQLGIGRSAIWKHVQALDSRGLDVFSVRGKGYKLASPIELLDYEKIRSQLTSHALARLDYIDILDEVDSTNDYLKARLNFLNPGRGHACMAEMQSAGRGRRGRRWISPYGTNLYLSLGWHLDQLNSAIGGLSLATAVAVVRALTTAGIKGLGLKWPNDIFLNDGKLAGILIDLVGESGGSYRVVIGIGVNTRLPHTAAREIDQPWSDLVSVGMQVDRNYIASMILNELVDALEVFSVKGLDAFIDDWMQFDMIATKHVQLHQGEQLISGVAKGIDANGALLIEYNGSVKSFHAGEVSVRLTP